MICYNSKIVKRAKWFTCQKNFVLLPAYYSAGWEKRKINGPTTYSVLFNFTEWNVGSYTL